MSYTRVLLPLPDHAGDASQQAQRELNVDALEVVLPRTHDGDGFAVARRAALLGRGSACDR